MLIEIDESIATSAKLGNQNSLQALHLIATSQSMGYHIVWAQRKTLKLILTISQLGPYDLNIYNIILKKYVTKTSDYKKITFRTIITNRFTTSYNINGIIINPDEVPNFNYVNRTVILAENLSDINFFEYIALYYLKEINLNKSINIEFDKQLGGGDTTSTEYEKYSVQKERFCLCILDGDRKYDSPTALYGQTYKNVKTIADKIGSFNCIYYGTQRVLEIENLIPSLLYLSDSNYKNEQIIRDNLLFDLSFFDLKEGIKYKSLIDPNVLTYWKRILASYNNLINDINLIEELINNNVQEFRKAYEKEVIIKGFGSKLLETVLSRHKAKLQNIISKDLTPNQIFEWNLIGKHIIHWCCAINIPKISLS